MRRLDGPSAFQLLSTKPKEYRHTLKIGIFDTSKFPGGWSYDRFKEGLIKGMQFHPIFRCKIKRVPFGLHRPVWVDDAEFDIEYHLRYVSCPPPGDNKALCALISQVYAYPLDPDKPLWQTWVIDGVSGGQVAVVNLVHHAYVDGTGAARLMERYFSHQPLDITPAMAEWHAEETPSQAALLLAAMRDIPRSLITGVPRVIHGVREMRRVRRQYAESGEHSAPDPFRDSRDSPFNTLLGHRRTFVFESLSLDAIRASAKGFGVTINDLFLAVVADVYRQFMLERNYNVDKGPLLATIPAERRPPVEQDDMIGNKVSADWLWLPVHIADPLERLRYAQASSLAMKKHFKATEGADLASLMEILPLPFLMLSGKIVKHNKQAIGLMGNAILSNVKGPVKPLYMGQMLMTNWISTGPVVPGMAINITVWSYMDKFNLCIMADQALLPDGWGMIERFKESFKRYEALAGTTVNRAASP